MSKLGSTPQPESAGCVATPQESDKDFVDRLSLKPFDAWQRQDLLRLHTIAMRATESPVSAVAATDPARELLQRVREWHRVWTSSFDEDPSWIGLLRQIDDCLRVSPQTKPDEARRLAILDCAQMVNGRLAGREEGSDLWLEIIKITRMLERLANGDTGLRLSSCAKPDAAAWGGNADGLTALLEENKRLKELAERQMNDAEAARLELAEARFRPMGDNHHNAVLCPYCNPLLNNGGSNEPIMPNEEAVYIAKQWANLEYKPLDCPPGSMTINRHIITLAREVLRLSAIRDSQPPASPTGKQDEPICGGCYERKSNCSCAKP